MKFFCGTSVIALVINLCNAELLPRYRAPLKELTRRNGGFDFLMLSMNYRAGTCMNNSKCVPPDDSFHPLWTIHGLWPSSKDGEGPSFCRTSQKFDVKALGRIRARLNESWPTFMSYNSQNFWRHEFNKHGSCAIAGKLEDITNSFSYFDKTLNVSQNFNVTEYLKGVKSNNKTPVALTALIDAIRDKFPARVQFHCEGQKAGSSVLQEIRLCFNKKFQPFNCPELRTCTTEEVWYLKSGAASLTYSFVIISILVILALIDRGSS